jgi:hypothetical protein
MKKIYASVLVSFLIITSLSFQSCDKFKDTLFPGFETEPADIVISIPVIPSTSAETAVASVTVYFNMDSIIKAETLNAFSIRNVDKISMQQLRLSMQNADVENNFGNLENLSVSFHSNANINPIVIAETPAIADESVSELALVPDVSANLRGYMDGSQLTFTISGKARRVTTKPLTCLLHIRLKMN